MPTYEDFVQNLIFDFAKVGSKADFKTWPTIRTQYHQITSQIHDQILSYALKLQKQRDTLKIAFFCPDVYPQNHEHLINMLSESFEKAYLPTPALLKRNQGVIQNLKKLSIKDLIDWHDPETFRKFDLIVCFIGSSSMPIVTEIAREQVDYQDTQFFITAQGVSLARARQLLLTDKVMCPALQLNE